MLLTKDVYPYEYMDEWEKVNETILPEKKNYRNLNVEDVTDTDYTHAKIVSKDDINKFKWISCFLS